MSFGDHLDELRVRLVHTILGLIPIAIVALVFGRQLLSLLIIPVESQLKAAGLPPMLQATSPVESFGVYLLVSMVSALVVGTPWIFIQLWLFVKPGLLEQERRFARFLTPISAILTAVSVAFLYTVLLPVSLRFLIVFGSTLAPTHPGTIDNLETQLPTIPILQGDPENPEPGEHWINQSLQQLRFAIPTTTNPDSATNNIRILGIPLTGSGAVAQQYRISEYINLALMLTVVIVLAFQLPIVMLLLGWSGILRPEDLTPHRKHILFVCAIAGAILTPADPASMLLLAAPLYALFELGVLLMRFFPARRVAGTPEHQTDAMEGDE